MAVVVTVVGASTVGLASQAGAVPGRRVRGAQRLASERARLAARAVERKPGMAVQTMATDQEILDALFTDAACQAFVSGVTVTATDPSVQVQALPSYGRSVFSGSGGVLVLSSGDPLAPSETTAWGEQYCPGDTARVDIDFNITDPSIRSMSMQFDVYSYEYPTYVGAFNDFAFAYWDETITTNDACFPDQAAQYCPNGLGCAGSTSATRGLLTFDNQIPCQPTMINSAFFQLCSVLGCDSAPGVPGWETTYDEVPGDISGRTGVLTASWPVSTGVHRLTLMVGDYGDGLVDSAAAFARLRCSSQATGCASTEQQQGENIPALSWLGLALLALLLGGLGAWEALART
jgi:hypothetical protein